MQARKYPDLVDIMNTRKTPPYPYAPGQTKGGDTSTAAQAKASRNTLNDRMRNDALEMFYYENQNAESIARLLEIRWRDRYESHGDYLQDCRRRCSELVKLGLIEDSGERALSDRNRKGSLGNTTIRVWKLKK